MGLFLYIFSFEGVVAYQVRYSIMACDHLFSVLYTHLGGLEQRHLSMMCGDGSETVCEGEKAIMCMGV